MSGIDKLKEQRTRDEADGPLPLKMRTMGEVLDMNLPPKKYVVRPAIPKGAVSAIVGEGGTGKSRLVLWLWAARVAGVKQLGDLSFDKWDGGKLVVFGGNENDVHRYQSDGRELLSAFPNAREEIRNSIVLHCVEDVEDGVDGGEESMQRMTAAIKACGDVDAVVFDPLSDYAAFLNLNDDADMKALVLSLRKCVRAACPEAACVIVHHARGGRQATATATDTWGRGEFGRNSKMLAATARSVVNVTRLDDDGGIVLACGKCNDARPFEALALEKVPCAGYRYKADFDVEEYKRQVSGKGTAGRKPEVVVPLEAVRMEFGGEVWKKGDIEGEIRRRFGASRQAASDAIDDLCEDWGWEMWVDGAGNNTKWVGVPEKVSAKRAEILRTRTEKHQGKLNLSP